MLRSHVYHRAMVVIQTERKTRGTLCDASDQIHCGQKARQYGQFAGTTQGHFLSVTCRNTIGAAGSAYLSVQKFIRVHFRIGSGAYRIRCRPYRDGHPKSKHENLYRFFNSGYSSPTLVGIPSGGQHVEQAQSKFGMCLYSSEWSQAVVPPNLHQRRSVQGPIWDRCLHALGMAPRGQRLEHCMGSSRS